MTDSKIFRRSLYFSKDLVAGHVISDKDICRIHLGFGLSPKHMPEVLEKKLKVSVKQASAVSWDVFKQKTLFN